MESLDKNHYIALANGKFELDDNGINHQENLKIIFSNLSSKEHEEKPLVVHFHGGLVNEKNGKEVAQKLTPVYKAAGGYPLFFVWESGLLETVGRNLPEHISGELGKISKDEVYGRLVKLLEKFVISKLESLGIPEELRRGPAPIELVENNRVKELIANFDERKLEKHRDQLELNSDEADQLENILKDDPELTAMLESIGSDGPARGGEVRVNHELPPEIVDMIKDNGDGPRADGEEKRGLNFLTIIKYIAKIGIAVFKRYRSGTHHGIRLTLTEEILRSIYINKIGTFVWSDMKKDTADAFQVDANVYGGTAFIEHLKVLTGTKKRRVVLVGHSTGAVYICNLLRMCDELGVSPDVTFDVVFLAPACNYDLLHETLKKGKARISNFRSFGMKDELEMKDAIAGFVYPASLLYFVSSLLEGTEVEHIDKPIFGMHRYTENRFPYAENDKIQEVLAYTRDKMFWSITDAGFNLGEGTDSSGHGRFDEENDLTMKSVQHIIKKGYLNE